MESNYIQCGVMLVGRDYKSARYRYCGVCTAIAGTVATVATTVLIAAVTLCVCR
jgi:hypothetical protein